MHIVLYFGSFNPIHTGHLIVASQVADRPEVDNLWLVVSPQNPFKKKDDLWNESIRLKLVQQAIENDPRLSCSDIEFTLPRPSFTIDTIKILKQLYPTCVFSILIGSDHLPSLPKWKDFDVLAAQHHFYIYPRLNFPIDAQFLPHHVIIDSPMIDLSATYIRELIDQNKSVRYIVPSAVEDYLSGIDNSHMNI